MIDFFPSLFHELAAGSAAFSPASLEALSLYLIAALAVLLGYQQWRVL